MIPEWTIPFIAGPVIGLLSIWLAYLAYKRGKKADDEAQEHAAIAQVYTGYGGLLERYQTDNRELRQRVAELERENAEYRRKERENGKPR